MYYIITFWQNTEKLINLKKEPDRGLEPLTVGLKVQRSTD